MKSNAVKIGGVLLIGMMTSMSVVSALAFSTVPLGHRSMRVCETRILPPRTSSSNLFLASSLMQASDQPDAIGDDHPVTQIKQGINALRATMRAATGISLTAMYLSFVAFTSGLVRGSMTFVLAIFPTWFRYFLQPFLILYYVPLYMLRTWSSPKKREERRALHDEIMNDFKRGVQAAGAAHEAGYWPLQFKDTGGLTASFPPELEIEVASDNQSEFMP